MVQVGAPNEERVFMFAIAALLFVKSANIMIIIVASSARISYLRIQRYGKKENRLLRYIKPITAQTATF
jgi:hypothetical protein